MKHVGVNLAFDKGYVMSGPNVLVGNKVLTGTLLPFAGNWYRLCSMSNSNAGYMAEFYLVIPTRHVMLKVTFAKTTQGAAYGSGILKVELLGSYNYGHAHPYLWRVVDNGTNGQTFVDIRFPNADGTSSFAYQVHLLASIQNGTAIDFPLSSQGSGVGAGILNFGFSMGTGAGEGWTSQQVTLNATNGAYEALSNTFARTVGTATAY
ncbi:hypothetical protein IB236_13220 [Acidovorax sp. ACV02]|uniref:hypothetical protein n=1 Tax=Acidovorax sp. ACV02 TaxID=2769310 RepID=UPI0017834CBC|nr:hypothetical protein [Acidovorax sp. ACV02]MBD9406303.1 hypothetical protein [Acidovorax sp. ACV02]